MTANVKELVERRDAMQAEMRRRVDDFRGQPAQRELQRRIGDVTREVISCTRSS